MYLRVDMDDYIDGPNGGTISDVFFPCGEMALRRLDDFQIRALGRRRKDWQQRDLLFGGTRRDGRAWVIRKLHDYPDERLLERIKDLPEHMHGEALRFTIRNFVHYEWLARMSQSESESISDLARRMWACTPTGMFVALKSGDAPTYRCNMIRFCPFCLSRELTLLTERLKGLAVSPDHPDAMIFVRLTLTDEDFDYGARSDAHLFHQTARELLSAKARALMMEAGAIGGIVTCQLSPYQFPYETYDQYAVDDLPPRVTPSVMLVFS